MPAGLLRPCLTPGCPELVSRGRCATHAAAKEQARPNVDVRRWYHTARWQHLRAQVLRAEPFCEECRIETGAIVANTDVDHRIPHRGNPKLFWDRRNLNGKCHAHHSRKTNRGQ